MGDAGTDGGRATMDHHPATTGIETCNSNPTTSDNEQGRRMQGPMAASNEGTTRYALDELNHDGKWGDRWQSNNEGTLVDNHRGTNKTHQHDDEQGRRMQGPTAASNEDTTR